jgi:hypothetical protein
VDRHAAWLDHRVAEAADAWLTDPQDAAVYARLVTAVRERRAYQRPRLDQPPAGQEQLLEPAAGIRLGDLLGGEDPHLVLDRLLNADTPAPDHAGPDPAAPLPTISPRAQSTGPDRPERD